MRKKKLLFFASAFFTVFFIFLVSRFPVPSPVYGEKKGYLTWEIPGFAYTNNQIVLDIAASLFNPTPRKIIAPPLRTPAIRGMDWLDMPLSSIFAFEEETFTNEASEVDTISQAIDSNKEYVNVTNKYEDFWGYMFPRFVIYVLVFGGKWKERAHEAIRKYKIREDHPITHCINSVMKTYPISESIGIHLRTWNIDVSLVDSNECERINLFNPLRILWSCHTGIDQLQSTIDMYPDKPVFIATDHFYSDVIKNLKQNNVERNIYAINYDYLFSECIPENSTDILWMKVHGSMFIDSELLSKSYYFFGNIFSTFSNIVYIKRKENSSFFRSNVLYWLFIITFILIMVFFLYRKKTSDKYLYVRTDDTELGTI